MIAIFKSYFGQIVISDSLGLIGYILYLYLLTFYAKYMMNFKIRLRHYAKANGYDVNLEHTFWHCEQWRLVIKNVGGAQL